MKQDDAGWQLDRLSADEAPELHRAVGIARQQLPSSRDLAALAASLSAQGLPSPGAASPHATHTTRLARKYWALVGGGVAGVGLVAGAAWLMAHPEVRGTPPPQPVSSASEGQAATLDANPGGLPGAARSKALTNRLKGVTSPSPSVPPEPSANAASSAVGQAPLAQALRASVPTSAQERAPTPGSGAVSALPNRSPVPRASTSSASQRAALPPVAATQPSEISLLRDARLALPSSPALALGLTEQHSALYPRGALAQERELIAITALARLGRHSAVLSRAQRFEADYPSSPYRKQIAQLAH